MNNPSNPTNKYVPKQAYAPTPQLYDELVGNCFHNLAKASLSLIPSLVSGSVIHDNGCGTGAATDALISASTVPASDISIKASDILPAAIEVYESRAKENSWPTETAVMDSMELKYPDESFSLSISNALLILLLPDDGIRVVKEIYRTLKPGGVAIVNVWSYIPNLHPLQTAAKATRGEDTPKLRAGLDIWTKDGFLKKIVEEGGFEREKIRVEKVEVFVTAPELKHYATMLWSFIGGTSEIGWVEEDEESWDQAVEIIIKELKKTEGFEVLEDGRTGLRFVASIVVATK